EGAVLERAQRRLAAILAADVVGYSRLVGQDETGTLRRLKELRRNVVNPIMREHHGRVRLKALREQQEKAGEAHQKKQLHASALQNWKRNACATESGNWTNCCFSSYARKIRLGRSWRISPSCQSY